MPIKVCSIAINIINIKLVIDLSIGEIIMDSSFTLHETLSSVEVMDPKMDSGINHANVKGLEESERLGILPIASELSLENVLFIMDKLLAAEILHFQGYTLIQTLFSCLYLHDPNRVLEGNKALLYFILSLLRRAHIIRESIILADNYEEEDFVYYHFGFSFCLELSNEELNQKMEQEIEKLEKKEEKSELECAILMRLKFSYNLTMAHMILEKKDRSLLKEAKKYFEKCSADINALKNSVSLVAPLRNDQHVFEPDLCRLSVHTTCPRPINWYTSEECFSIHEKMLQHYSEVLDVDKVGPYIVELEKLFTSLVRRGAQLPVRSRLLLTTFSEKKVFGKFSGEDLGYNDAVKIYSIPEAVFKNNSKNTSIHLGRMVIPLVNLFKALAHNPARRRRRFKKVLQDWAYLIQDAGGLDMQINLAARRPSEDNCRHFSYWQIDLSFRIVLDYLLIGFELDIYHDYEYPLIFWYIDNVMSNRFQNYTSHLSSIEKLKQKTLASHRKKNTRDKKPEVIKPPITPYMIELEAKFYLYRAIYKYLAALDWFKKIKYPSFNLSTHQTRYFSRLNGLVLIESLPTFRYSHFQKTYLDVLKKPDLQGKTLLIGATDAFKKAQDILKVWMATNPKPSESTTQEIKNLLRVSVMNSLQIQKLDLENNNGSIHLDFSFHHQFPVVSIK